MLHGVDMGLGDYTGVNVVVSSSVPDHAGKPKLERERSSGCINLSAQERNRKRLENAASWFVIGRTIYFSPRTYERVKSQLARFAKIQGEAARIQGAQRAIGGLK